MRPTLKRNLPSLDTVVQSFLHFQLELWVPDDNIQIVDLEDIAINAPTVGTKCEIYGWSLTTIVRTLRVYATHWLFIYDSFVDGLLSALVIRRCCDRAARDVRRSYKQNHDVNYLRWPIFCERLWDWRWCAPFLRKETFRSHGLPPAALLFRDRHKAARNLHRSVAIPRLDLGTLRSRKKRVCCTHDRANAINCQHFELNTNNLAYLIGCSHAPPCSMASEALLNLNIISVSE